MPLAIRIDTGKKWTSTKKRVSALFEGKRDAQSPLITPQLPTLENLRVVLLEQSVPNTERSVHMIPIFGSVILK